MGYHGHLQVDAYVDNIDLVKPIDKSNKASFFFGVSKLPV